jgi:hypothetical protein
LQQHLIAFFKRIGSGIPDIPGRTRGKKCPADRAGQGAENGGNGAVRRQSGASSLKHRSCETGQQDGRECCERTGWIGCHDLGVNNTLFHRYLLTGSVDPGNEIAHEVLSETSKPSSLADRVIEDFIERDAIRLVLCRYSIEQGGIYRGRCFVTLSGKAGMSNGGIDFLLEDTLRLFWTAPIVSKSGPPRCDVPDIAFKVFAGGIVRTAECRQFGGDSRGHSRGKAGLVSLADVGCLVVQAGQGNSFCCINVGENDSTVNGCLRVCRHQGGCENQQWDKRRS